jgi:23S rRNA pseudouridine1911/1915/1917 synthase
MLLTADQRERLDKFLARSLPDHSRTKLTKLIESGGVLVDGKVPKSSFPLEPGMTVELEEPETTEPHDLTPANIPIEVVFEDESLMVVNKPRGLASHPAASLKEPSLVNALLYRETPLSSAAGDFRPGIVHRLDKETTGLMVVAKNDSAHVTLAKQLESKTAERRYLAVVAGYTEQENFTVNFPIGRSKMNRQHMVVDPKGKRAVTHLKRIARLDQGTLVAAKLETGRTHQIRVHLKSIGHPILGDNLYAPREYATGAMQLHAAFLAFDHPVTGERVSFYADPDEEFLGHEWANRETVDPW